MPITIHTKLYNLPKQIRKNCHNLLENLELLNEAIQKGKFINHQRRKVERQIEKHRRKNIRHNQKCWKQLEFDLQKGNEKNLGSTTVEDIHRFVVFPVHNFS
jgi:hypothetical protein